MATTRLEVMATTRMPVPELSGLGRQGVSGQEGYLAVGDRTSALVTFEVDAEGAPANVRVHDLSPLFGDGPSQWEAVAGDGAGAVFVLAEASDTIHVLSPALDRVDHRIHLTVPDDHPLSRSWQADPNSRGEGLVLLSNGHVLVVKEKNPVALVEFAPIGDAAEGYEGRLAIGDRTFPISAELDVSMVAVKHWTLKTSDEDRVTDVSEITVDGEGRLLLLSDQARAAFSLERGLRVDEDRLDIKAALHLPPVIDKPEGLILVEGRILVGVDEGKRVGTLFTVAARR